MLGASEDAAQKRVSRAIGKLRCLLSDRGIAFSTTVLTSLLKANAITPAPASLGTEVFNQIRAGSAISKATSAGGTASTPLTVKALLAAALVLSTVAFLLFQRNGEDVGKRSETVISSDTLPSEDTAIFWAKGSQDSF